MHFFFKVMLGNFITSSYCPSILKMQRKDILNRKKIKINEQHKDRKQGAT
jgi:hypothetical protein